VPRSTTSTSISELCKPGWGKGDKNHCHSGPPGQVDKSDGKHGDKSDGKHVGKSDGKHGRGSDESLRARFVDYVRPTTGAGLGVLALVIALSVVGVCYSAALRRRRA
jgi:hypothetical protein